MIRPPDDISTIPPYHYRDSKDNWIMKIYDCNCYTQFLHTSLSLLAKYDIFVKLPRFRITKLDDEIHWETGGIIEESNNEIYLHLARNNKICNYISFTLRTLIQLNRTGAIYEYHAVEFRKLRPDIAIKYIRRFKSTLNQIAK